MGSEFDVEPFGSLLSNVVDNRGRTCPTGTERDSSYRHELRERNDSLYPSYDTVRYVDEQTYKTWFRVTPNLATFCLYSGSPGRVCLVPDPGRLLHRPGTWSL